MAEAKDDLAFLDGGLDVDFFYLEVVMEGLL